MACRAHVISELMQNVEEAKLTIEEGGGVAFMRH